MKYTFMLLLLPFTCFAQKLITNTDKLNGTTTYMTSPEKLYYKGGIGAGEILSFNVAKTNNTYMLSLVPSSGKISLTEMDSTNRTYIKYTDGNIDTLKAVSVKMIFYEAGGFNRMLLNYYLTDSIIAHLKSNPIAFIRIETNDRPADYDLPDKNTQLIQKALALLP